MCFGVGYINNACVKHSARFVNNGYLTACPVAGVKTEGYLALYGRLKQQGTKVSRKDLYCIRIGSFCEH